VRLDRFKSNITEYLLIEYTQYTPKGGGFLEKFWKNTGRVLSSR